jgi:hypothetical protein
VFEFIPLRASSLHLTSEQPLTGNLIFLLMLVDVAVEASSAAKCHPTSCSGPPFHALPDASVVRTMVELSTFPINAMPRMPQLRDPRVRDTSAHTHNHSQVRKKNKN